MENKLTLEYTKRFEACGFVTYRCSFCEKCREDEASMRSHIAASHTLATVKCYTAEKKILSDRKRHHADFPVWRRTTATDQVLRDWFAENRGRCYVAPRGLNIVLVSVQCMFGETHLYYCPLCHFATPPSEELQRRHFYEKHVDFVANPSSSRYFYC